MADERRYFVGERVLVSRVQDGENHEEATVVDFYELLIEGDKIPSVVVDFDDGERLYITAREPNVMPIELDEGEEDDEDWDDDEADEGDEGGDEDEADDEVAELDADHAFRGGHDEEDDEEE
jgi:hypothetical protein